MRKLPLIALAGAASVALAGTAIARPQTHVMEVPLPDGSVAHIEYAGNVEPKVTIAPAVAQDTDDGPDMLALPNFAGFERMMAQLQRQSQEMIRQAQQASRQAPGGTPYVASYGNLPAGATSTSVVSVSNGSGTCTRTTEIVSQGPGKPPKVTSNVSGDCSASPAAPGKPVT